MSWFSLNLDLLFRTCFALETDSQTCDLKKPPPAPTTSHRPNHLKISSAPSKGARSHHFACPSPSPSAIEKTDSVLSISTLAESSANTSTSKNTADSTPSYLDSQTCRQLRHRRETSQNDVLCREEIEVDGILYSGRFGSSLLARYKHKKSDDVVILNAYHKAVLTETYQQHIPQREKALLQSFDHPFISTVLGTFSDRNCLYLVSPAEPGGPLSHLLHNSVLSEGITDKMKTFYAACVLSVLKYAHSLNIIHRGLHPDSLLIDAKGYLKVADWGFAKQVTERTYTLCGHVEYLCPEAIVHDSGYGKGADYWALGVLIYDMFVGRSAFVPSSLNFKYDCKFDDRVVLGTGANSAHSSNSSGSSKSNVDQGHIKHSLSSNSLSGVERSPSPSPAQINSGQNPQSKPASTALSGDTLDQHDPTGHDTGTINNILTRDPIYPSYMPHPTKSIVQGLCQKNVTQRLGTQRNGNGIEDIQMHIFFQDMEWSRLNKKLVAAPWIPSSCVEGEAESEKANSSPEWAKFYPNYTKKHKLSEVELHGPVYGGYNCPDWNSFV